MKAIFFSLSDEKLKIFVLFIAFTDVPSPMGKNDFLNSQDKFLSYLTFKKGKIKH
jgi:hypothetical protein